MTLKNSTKWISILSTSLLLAACGDKSEGTDNAEDASGSSFDASSNIHVITREDGSGTRGAFVEIAGVVDENEDDNTTATATVQNSTSGVMQAVAGDVHSMGYISLGSLDDSVTGLAVDGVEPTPETVASGEYKVARNFNIAYGEELNEATQDFYTFMFSAQAQKIVEEQGYVSVDTETPEYEAQDVSGEISIVGSTSVEPLMQALAEAYKEHNPNVTIDITAPGSGAGITAVIDGSADIGMASRELDEEETSQVAGVDAIAIDGIAVIVHNDNPLKDLTLEQIQSIYLGETTTWDEIQ